MKNLGEHIKAECRRMKVEQCLNIDSRMFAEAFPCGFPSIYRTPEQAFLSSMIGSAWGAWRVCIDPFSDAVTICRHKEDPNGRRWYVDPDREHLFNKMPDGTLERKAEP